MMEEDKPIPIIKTVPVLRANDESLLYENLNSKLYPEDRELDWRNKSMRQMSEDALATQKQMRRNDRQFLRFASDPSSSPIGGLVGREINRVLVYSKIRLYQYANNPYTDLDLQRFEAAVRRNHAVRTALLVREFFTFGKGSELKLYLPDEDTQGFETEEAEETLQAKIDANGPYTDAMTQIEEFEKKLKAIEHFKTLWWHGVCFGRAVIIKLHPDWISQQITRLINIHPRRLSYPILDIANDLSFEGLYIDGQPLDKSAMIYAKYQDRQISPHTEHFGFSLIEPIAHLAETLNIMMEEDFKEIAKSAWLKSFLLAFNTAGMTDSDAQTNMQNILDNIKPGIFTGVSTAVTATPLDFRPDLGGLDMIAQNLETRIYKNLQVPEFLVDSQKVVNRSTALTAATMFLSGVVSDDQKWLAEILEEQWYEPLLRWFLDNENQDGKFQKKDENGQYIEVLQLKIKRTFNQAKVSNFDDLATALVALKGAAIWDTQKCNEVLESEEVTARIEQAQAKMMDQMQNAPPPFQDKNQSIGQQAQPNLQRSNMPSENSAAPDNRAAKEAQVKPVSNIK